MSFDAVLRIKRKRTDESLTMLLTSDAAVPEGKKRRVWQLSRSSDSRGIPVPISTRLTMESSSSEKDIEMDEVPSPPRFSVRKRKASESYSGHKSQNILDLEREYKTSSSDNDLETPSLADNEVLSSMLSEYLSANDLTQTSNSSAEEDYVYDIYYPQATTQAIEDATVALKSNYGLLEHFNWDETNNLVVDDDDVDSDGEGSEDSNAEDWAGNEYPDEEDMNGTSSDDDDDKILGSDSETDETFDRSDWD